MLPSYADLRPHARRYLLAELLPVVLGALLEPAGTATVADALEPHLAAAGVPVVGRKARAQLGRDLVALAPTIPEAAQSSVTFKLYGRDMRAWVWSPRPGTYAHIEQKYGTSPAAGIAAELRAVQAISAAPAAPEVPPLRSAAPEPGTPAYRAMRLAEVDTILAAKPIDDGKFPLGEGEEEW